MRISDWSSDVCSSDLGQEPMPSTFDHFRQGLGPEELREDHGRLAGRIIEIEGNAVAPMLSEDTADLRIAICPVADERNNTSALQRIFGGLCIDPDLERKSTRLHSSH